MRYGKLLIEDSSISARYRPISLEPEEVAELLNSPPLAVAESSLRALEPFETDEASLVPDWSIKETLESFEERLAAPQRSAQLMMRLRAFSELLGDEFHLAEAELLGDEDAAEGSPPQSRSRFGPPSSNRCGRCGRFVGDAYCGNDDDKMSKRGVFKCRACCDLELGRALP